jgi:hypothetical protein
MNVSDKKHPIQPIGDDGQGVLRFKENKVVRYLLDHGGLDLNDLVRADADLPREDWEQFHQLIGYSVSGIPSLSPDTRAAVHEIENGLEDWRDARIQALERLIAEYRQHASAFAVAVFDIHPDALIA